MIDKNKVITLQMTDRGILTFGTGYWTENTCIYVTNFLQKDGVILADIDTKSDDSYINRTGRKCYRHRMCGSVQLTKELCKIIIDIDGKEEYTCKPKVYTENNKRYVMLDFN